jgi:hypothetical protein
MLMCVTLFSFSLSLFTQQWFLFFFPSEKLDPPIESYILLQCIKFCTSNLFILLPHSYFVLGLIFRRPYAITHVSHASEAPLVEYQYDNSFCHPIHFLARLQFYQNTLSASGYTQKPYNYNVRYLSSEHHSSIFLIFITYAT